MKKSTLLGFGLALIATSAMASNTGFKLNYALKQTPNSGSSNNWISLPYFYFPNGNVGQPVQNSIDLCTDLNGAPANVSKVGSVIRFDTATDLPKTQPCNSTKIKIFDLKAGEGYSVKPVNASITVDIVGSHDDAMAPNKTATPTLYPLIKAGTDNNWFSVPYHSIANNSIDMCTEFNGAPANASKVGSVIRFDTLTDLPKTQPCNSTKIKIFDIVPGEGYSVKPAALGISIGMNVY